MIALEKIKIYLNSFEFLMSLLGASLSLLLIGYAPSSITLGIFCVMTFRYFIIKKTKVKFDIALFLPFILYLFFSLSYFWSVNQEQTTKGLGRMIILLLLPIAFTLIPKISLKDYRFIFRIFVLTNFALGVFFLLIALYKFICTGLISVFTYHNFVEVLDLNAIYVTVIFSMGLFYLLSLKNKRLFDKFLIFFFLTLILLLSSKIIILVISISTVLFILQNKIYAKNKKKILLLSLFLIIGCIVGSITLKERFSVEKQTQFNEVFTKDTFGKVYYWTGSSIRLFQLRLLSEQLQEEPIILKGFGLFASKDNLKKRHTEYDTYSDFHHYNYHNQYAQILSELGIIGLLLLLTLLIVLTYKAIISKDYAFIMFSIMIIIIFFTESFLWRQRGLFLFVILYCLFNRVEFNKKAEVILC